MKPKIWHYFFEDDPLCSYKTWNDKRIFMTICHRIIKQGMLTTEEPSQITCKQCLEALNSVT